MNREKVLDIIARIKSLIWLIEESASDVIHIANRASNILLKIERELDEEEDQHE